MALALPKIVYPRGGGATLNFVYPPRKVPFRAYETVRHDNVASSGVRETVYERTDKFFEFEMEYVKLGTDVGAWDSFVQSALQGIAFDYYPDATLGSLTTYVLEDTTWHPGYKQLGMYSFTMRFRERVPWP